MCVWVIVRNIIIVILYYILSKVRIHKMNTHTATPLILYNLDNRTYSYYITIHLQGRHHGIYQRSFRFPDCDHSDIKFY